MGEPYIRVLGSADWCPTSNNDHSCYTVNDRILIDACPSVVVSLLSQSVDPVDINTICFTHMHADHYMGLAPLLLYWRVRKASLGELTIIGPKATVRAAFERALNYVFHDSADISQELKEMPRVIELEGEAACAVEGYDIRVTDSDHAVPGLCYMITDRASGRTVGFTGDGRFQSKFGQFFKGAALLVHESGGPGTSPKDSGRHSSARDAVHVSAEAGVGKLLLTHTYEPYRQWALDTARRFLKIPVEWAMPGHTFDF